MPDATTDNTNEPLRLKMQWLEEAREGEHADGFAGKRGEPRFPWTVPLDVRSTGPDDRQTYLGTACDISATGLRFHCRKRIGIAVPIEIVAYGETVGVPAIVRHVTRTVNGYLVGAEFEV